MWTLAVWYGMVPSTRWPWKCSGGKGVKLHQPSLLRWGQSLGLRVSLITRLKWKLAWTVKWPTVNPLICFSDGANGGGVENDKWVDYDTREGTHRKKKKENN